MQLPWAHNRFHMKNESSIGVQAGVCVVSNVFCVGTDILVKLFSLFISDFKTNFYLGISAAFKIGLGRD